MGVRNTKTDRPERQIVVHVRNAEMQLGAWPCHPEVAANQRFGFDHMQLADNTREASNDYVQWLRGQRGELHGVVDPGMSHGVR